MKVDGPIVLIDDDEDDYKLLAPALKQIAPNSPIIVFTQGEKALEYLRTTDQRPFLILSEVSLHPLTGLELRRQIQQDPELRTKSIPFVFFTHPVHRQLVEEAYELPIHGFFEKKTRTADIKRQLQAIVDYWSNCLHPNRFDDGP
ncbi:hypothetical protein GCM10027347_60360 [Larkinella harenae]